MLFDAPSEAPKHDSDVTVSRSQARAETRVSGVPSGRSLLPSGSPFGWNARGRSLYVQFLTALLMVIVTLSFAVFDGWPFLLERPLDGDALRTTTILSAGALVFWLALYLWTWRRRNARSNGFSWLLFATVIAHIVTGTAVCYALGPYTAASGLITVAALLLGMVLLRRQFLWIAVVGWLTSMFLMHFASKAGVIRSSRCSRRRSRRPTSRR